jgi:suppressor of ftsI
VEPAEYVSAKENARFRPVLALGRSARGRFFLKRSGLALAFFMCLTGCNFDAAGPGGAAIGPPAAKNISNDVIVPPEIVSAHGVATVELAAAINSTVNLPGFLYEGLFVAPTIRVKPGDTIVIDMDDELPPGMAEGSDMNLHFHGLNVSPLRPHDDVLTMLAKPGRALYYAIKVPTTQPPGLYWYHPHVHGQTNYQVGEGGMSGAIVVEGIAAHLPALAKMPEHLLIVRQLGSNGGEIVRAPESDDGSAGDMQSMPALHRRSPIVGNVPCAPEPAGVFLSVNSRVKPTIRIDPGQPAFFRVLNATGHRHLDLSLGGLPMHIVSFDGYPVDTNVSNPATLTQTHIIVPPAGRVEFVASPGASTELRSLCFDSGPIGDGDPAALLAVFRPAKGSAASSPVGAPLQLVHDEDRSPRLGAAAPLAPPAATRTVAFSEDANGFYLNGKAFSPSAKPMFVVHTGTIERWELENLTSEDHDFHLHQTHFLVEKTDGVADIHPLWRDTVVVPHRTRRPDGSWQPGTVSILADFRDPVIRGTFLFHCHILDHEDQGMMAKIEAI